MSFDFSPMDAVMQVADPVARRSRLMVCIPFAYRSHRLRNLPDMQRLLSEMPVERVEILVYTNTAEAAELAVIRRLRPGV